MPILSLKFALFVFISLVIYYLLPGRWQNRFLLLASFTYYLTWSWSYLLILLTLAIFNFVYGFFLERRSSHRRLFLWLGVSANSIALLIFLLNPYYRSFLETSFHLEGRFLLPLGMSYYVVQCIAYLVDISLKIVKPTRNWVDFTLHLVYFPKLVSGPVEIARHFLPQLASRRVVDNYHIARNMMLILVGLTRAVVFAGSLSILAPAAWLDKPQNYHPIQLITGSIVFLFFLYNQFNGYTNIVCGVSGMFGIELKRNFMYPFFSQDFSDFWKRWHISLSQWLRDYIYMPLSRSLLRRNPSRANLPNLIFPPLVTMLVSGLWHGATPNMLVWGALNGGYIIAENLLNLYRPAMPASRKPPWRKIISSLAILGFAALAAIPFRLDLATSKVFLHRLVFGWGEAISDFRPAVMAGVFFVVVLSLLVDWLQYRASDEYVFLKWPAWLQASLAALIILAVLVVGQLQNTPSMFVYP